MVTQHNMPGASVPGQLLSQAGLAASLGWEVHGTVTIVLRQWRSVRASIYLTPNIIEEVFNSAFVAFFPLILLKLYDNQVTDSRLKPLGLPVGVGRKYVVLIL